MAIKEYYFEGKNIDAALENAAAQLKSMHIHVRLNILQ